MTIKALQELFKRDLIKLKNEIELYKSEESLWKIDKNIKNSGGNLSLHLIGNLKTYIGNGLAKTEYVRQREFEFSGKFVDRKDIYQQIDETIEIVQKGFDRLQEEQLKENFPLIIWQKETGMAYTILHLYAHFNYHLGQINYHRRLLDKS